MLKFDRIVLCGFVIALLIFALSGCSSVLTGSEDFYKDRPPRRINWREYLTD
ncbi:MAG TPA: hypothetical protein VJQ55_09735 [Candidatus Binatia bacterium]|nr:hypothetical protein [Candidatus Binatia bacterium]